MRDPSDDTARLIIHRWVGADNTVKDAVGIYRAIVQAIRQAAPLQEQEGVDPIARAVSAAEAMLSYLVEEGVAEDKATINPVVVYGYINLGTLADVALAAPLVRVSNLCD